MGCRCKDCPVSRVDLAVKSQVIDDCLRITSMSQKQDLKTAIDGRYRSYERIFPLEDERYLEIYDSFKVVRKYFYELSSTKETFTLSTGSFQKLISN